MPVSPTQVGLLVALLVAFGFIWYYEGRGRWRSLVDDRFIYGVPWGTLVTVGLVVAFYLFAQGGFRHWNEPVIFPFISWSYLYPTGVLTAGFAHANPNHIVSNMTGTLLLAPVAEYAWSHYAPRRGRDGGRSIVTDGGTGGLFARPWVRAVVIFPAALLGSALLTSVFSLGPGLGFSGAVFAIFGFAVVNYPVSTLVAVLGSFTLRTIYTALTTPVVTEGIEAAPPSPPAWAGIGWQPHLFGFLLGVLAGIALLSQRDRTPDLERVFFATFVLGMVQSLWLFVSPAGPPFTLYRGAGVAFVALLTVVIAVAVAGSNRPIPKPLSRLDRRPSRRHLAVVWLVVVATLFVLTVAGIVLEGEAVGFQVGVAVLLAVLLALPALPPVAPRRILAGPISRRQAAVVVIVAVTLVVVAPSIPFSLISVGEDSVPGEESIEVGDYRITYADNATAGQEFLFEFPANETVQQRHTGVFVVSENRQMWTTGARNTTLSHAGNATVVVGDLGWRAEVEANRTGWEVTGNDTVYAVDLTVDDETTRSYRSPASRAEVRIDGHGVTVVPVADDFQLRVDRDGSRIGETAIPGVNESATIGEVVFEARQREDTTRIVASTGDTEVTVAERETYD